MLYWMKCHFILVCFVLSAIFVTFLRSTLFMNLPLKTVYQKQSKAWFQNVMIISRFSYLSNKIYYFNMLPKWFQFLNKYNRNNNVTVKVYYTFIRSPESPKWPWNFSIHKMLTFQYPKLSSFFIQASRPCQT